MAATVNPSQMPGKMNKPPGKGGEELPVACLSSYYVTGPLPSHSLLNVISS